MSDNPDDTVVLRVAGGPAGGPAGKRWEVGRDAKGIDGLWEELLQIVSSPTVSENDPDSDVGDGTHTPEWSVHLDAANALQDMAEAALNRLPSTFPEGGALRPDVKDMIQIYVQGQKDILAAGVKFAQDKERAALRDAGEQGIEVIMED